MIVYNKLVRDKIPQIIKESGKDCKVRTLDKEEYLIELRKKLIEESTELLEATNTKDAIEELADIYELLETILIEEQYDLLEIKKRRIQKNMAKGAFEERLFLERVE